MSFSRSEKERKKDRLRREASGIIKATHKEGRIKLNTLLRLTERLDKMGYKYHFEVAVQSGSLLKVIDTEKLANETIDNIDKHLGTYLQNIKNVKQENEK